MQRTLSRGPRKMICLGLETDQIDDAHGTPLPGGPRPGRARADNAARTRIRATAAILGGFPSRCRRRRYNGFSNPVNAAGRQAPNTPRYQAALAADWPLEIGWTTTA